MSKPSTTWLISRAIAQVTLRDRGRRRKFITALLAVIISLFALGVFPLDAWLMKGLWRFLIFWGVTGFLCLFLLLMGAYDALAVIREENQKLGLDVPPTEDSSDS